MIKGKTTIYYTKDQSAKVDNVERRGINKKITSKSNDLGVNTISVHITINSDKLQNR